MAKSAAQIATVVRLNAGHQASSSQKLKRRKPEAYPVDTSPALLALIRKYESSGALRVSFRKLVSWIKMGERATHYLHPYPAKLLPQIVHFFLAARSLSDHDAVVLDPFCGSGTVALEAILSGRTALYADANPLARLISSAKTKLVSKRSVQSALLRIRKRYARLRTGPAPDVVNMSLWYEDATVTRLRRLKAAIEGERDSKLKDFLRVTFSAVVRKVSNADPRFSVPVRRKKSISGNARLPKKSVNSSDVWRTFERQLASNVERQKSLEAFSKKLPLAQSVGADARCLLSPASSQQRDPQKLPNSSVGMIVTSPPYAGAQKYIRAGSLSIGWLGLAASQDLKELERASIGREHFVKAQVQNLELTGIREADEVISKAFKRNPTRAAIASRYLLEMKDAIRECCRVLKPGGHVVLIIGNNELCGEDFRSSDYLCAMLQEAGLNLRLKLVDKIKSRGLITRRNKTAGVIMREWIILLEKPIS